MTNGQLKETSSTSTPRLFAGIDVGSENLVLVVRKNGKPFDPQKYANTRADRGRMTKKLSKLTGIVVCIEATGIYHLIWLSLCMMPA